MKTMRNLIGLLLLIALIGGAWVLRYHTDWLKPAAKEEKKETVEIEVPVKTAKIVKATLHRYVEGFGTVEPEPARAGRQPAGAAVASPIAGNVAKVLCEPGQHVSQGSPLVQLDDRLAEATEEQAAAALASAQATLAKLKATPRPEQLEVARLTVEKARTTAEFAEKDYERQKKLAPQQVTSEKSLQAAEQDLAAARNDLRIAEKQLVLLKSSPTPEELAEAAGKVNEAEKALAPAKTQRALLTIQSPLDATVVRIVASPGGAVDASRALVELVALDRLGVNASVPADDLPLLATGQDVEITSSTTAAHADKELAEKEPTTQPAASTTRLAEASDKIEPAEEGKTCFIAPEAERKTNTALVGVALPPKTALRPGQFVRVRIVVEKHAHCLAVPRESVVSNAEGNTVIAIVSGDKARQVPVHAALREGELVEVQGEGLHEGDTVVTAGAYGWPEDKKEINIRLIEQ